MKKNYALLLWFAGAFGALNVQAQLVATMDDLSLEPESYWNGSDGSGNFTSGPVTFKNQYNAEYFFWSGFAYSNVTDNTTVGYANQYSSIAGKGALESENYAIGYIMVADTITFDKPADMYGMFVTNSTYAALSMKNGDDYSKKFGGETGNDEDWFKLTVKGWNAANQLTGTVEFYLADYRFSDNVQDYILSDWAWVDLTPLKNNSLLTFELSSTDNGDWGMNTPAYFCADQITVKDLTSITFRVDDGTSTIDGALVELDGLTLTTDINGEVTFQNVSPTTQMVVKASKEGYVSYETEINGFFTSSFAISLLADDVNEQLQIQTQISPNPAQEQVLVSCTSEIQRIRIINMAGQSVINLYCNESMEQKVSINQLERGVYLMEVETRNGKSMQKMMKQ